MMWQRKPLVLSNGYLAGRGFYRRLLTQSHDRGPIEPPLLDQTVPQHFESIVRKFGERTAVVSRHQGKRLTYQALDLKSNALAHGLQGIGVKKGDRVAISLGNSIEFAIATYGIFKIGAVLVPLNPAFTTLQVIAALNHLEASHLIIGAETNLSRKPPQSNFDLISQLSQSQDRRTPEAKHAPSLQHIIVANNTRISQSGAASVSAVKDIFSIKSLLPFDDVLVSGGNGREVPVVKLYPDEVVNIQFTSGTTSMPKAASLTHCSILNNGKSIGDRMLLTEHDIICCPPPLFHCFGCILGYMATATHGSAIVFPAEAFDPVATLKSIQEEKCTALYGVPTMYSAELELLKNGSVASEGFEHLRTGIAAGSSVPAELMRKLHQTLNLTELTICYGMTETSPVSVMTTTDDPMDKRIDSVGRCLPHVEAKIVDPEDHTKILPIGTRGELAVSGYLVMQGYWGDAVKTKEVMVPDESGKIWMHTGDEGSMDAEGYIRITGRIKDLIIRGGENIHPLEVENCILGHAGVAEASVVGVSDERYGEAVAAFVIVHRGIEITGEEVREWVRGHLSRHLVPRYVFFVDTYPKTASGKIQKFALRAQGEELVKAGKGLG